PRRPTFVREPRRRGLTNVAVHSVEPGSVLRTSLASYAGSSRREVDDRPGSPSRGSRSDREPAAELALHERVDDLQAQPSVRRRVEVLRKPFAVVGDGHPESFGSGLARMLDRQLDLSTGVAQ